MYKVIYDNLVIDVIKTPKYLRYLSKSGRTALTDKTSAQCIIGSNDKDIYLLQGVNRPEGKEWKEVTLVPISETEYRTLSSLIMEDNPIYADKNQLQHVRNEKISELNNACSTAIMQGVTVLFSDNMYHTFELAITDQINLMDIDSQIRNGAKAILYHEKGKVCQMYSADDIQLLLDEVQRHRIYHTTYYNILKNYVCNLYDVNTIKDIYYGIELPEEYSIKLHELIDKF